MPGSISSGFGLPSIRVSQLLWIVLSYVLAWLVGPRLCPDPTKATHWITLVVIQKVYRILSTMGIIGINGWSVRNSLRALNEKETDTSYTSRRLFREVWHFCCDFRWVDLISKTISSYGGALRGRATRVQQLLQKGRGKPVGAAISTSSWCWLPWIAAARFGRMVGIIDLWDNWLGLGHALAHNQYQPRVQQLPQIHEDRILSTGWKHSSCPFSAFRLQQSF